MCWANQRLVAPASSAARQTSSISAVEENPSKNTPTGISHSLVKTCYAASRTVCATFGFGTLVNRQVCALDDLRPLLGIGLHVFAKLLRRAQYRLVPVRYKEFLLERGVGYNSLHIGIDLADDLARRSTGCNEPEVGYRFEIRQPALGNRRQFGEFAQPLRAAGRERSHLARLPRLRRLPNADEQRVDVTSHHGRQCRRPAAIVHGS